MVQENWSDQPNDRCATLTIPPVQKTEQATVKVEQLLHRFFGGACLDVEVLGKDGLRYTPREWFIAPLSIIEQAVHFLLTGEILQFQYDPDKQEIVSRRELAL